MALIQPDDLVNVTGTVIPDGPIWVVRTADAAALATARDPTAIDAPSADPSASDAPLPSVGAAASVRQAGFDLPGSGPGGLAGSDRSWR